MKLLKELLKAMEKFKEGVVILVKGVTLQKTDKKVMDNGRSNASCRVRCLTRTGSVNYELIVWGTKEDSQNVDVLCTVPANDRVVAVGFPNDDVFNGKVQHKISIEQMFAEDVESGEWACIVAKKATISEPEREFKPINMPEDLDFDL